MKRKIFVSGATGLQGTSISQTLIANNFDVVSLKPTSEEKRPFDHQLTLKAGDLGDKKILTDSLQGVKVAIFTFPLLFDLDKAKQLTNNFIEAAVNRDIEFVIFNSSFDLPTEATGLLALDLKLEVKRLFETSGLNVLTLVPDIYIDNLAAPWSIPLIHEKGILPYPVQSGSRVPWISHFDLAKFIYAAIDRFELAGQTLPIGGNLYTGEEIASKISDHLSKTVSFVSLKSDDFEKQLTGTFGELAAREISNLYRYVEENQKDLINKDFNKTQNILGVQLQTVDDWARSVKWH